MQPVKTQIVEDSYIIANYFPEAEPGTILRMVKEETDWEQLYNRGMQIPRLISFQGIIREDGVVPLYRSPMDNIPPVRPFNPIIQTIRDKMANDFGINLNDAKIQLYRNGIDYISEHSDKTLDIEHNTPILNLVVGATRKFIFTNKITREKISINVKNNTLIILGPITNRKYYHSVKRDKRPDKIKLPDELGERVSITLRQISTFLRPDGRIFGQGAKYKTEQEMLDNFDEISDVELEKNLMLEAFIKENTMVDFDWQQNYGRGFDTERI